MSAFLTVGTTQTVTYRVGRDNMVQRLLPGVAEFVHKPEVMASGWLLGVCEWPAMLAIKNHIRDDECSLGTRFELTHLAPVPAGATLTVSARCEHVEGIAAGLLGFTVVSLERFTSRRLAPKAAFLRRQRTVTHREPAQLIPAACGALAGVAAAV